MLDKKQSSANVKAVPYHSNPFRSTMYQLSLLVKVNPVSSLTLGALIIGVILLGIFAAGFLEGVFNSPTGDIIVLIGAFVYAIYFLLRLTAASYCLHTASREGRTLTAWQAITEVARKNYGQYLVTAIITNVFILLGFVALVIPGFYLLGRLSLAPYVALTEGLGAMKALRRSWELSEGHWFEVVGALAASALTLTSGLLLGVGSQSGLASRYFELTDLDRSSVKKTETHWMNYLLVGIAIVIVSFYALLTRAAIYSDINGPVRCDDTSFGYMTDCATTNPDPGMNMQGINDPSSSFDSYQSPAH